MTITDQDIERARDWDIENTRGVCSVWERIARYAAHITADLRQQLAEKDGVIKRQSKASKAMVNRYNREIARLQSALAAAEERAAIAAMTGGE